MTTEQFWARGEQIEREHADRLNTLRAVTVSSERWAALWRASFALRDRLDAELASAFHGQLITASDFSY